MSAPLLHEPMPAEPANATYAVRGQLQDGLQTEADLAAWLDHGLEGSDEAVGAQGGHAGGDPPQAFVFAPALPDQPGAADLGDGGQHEQGDPNFGRILAAYGGIFVAGSLAWGMLVDGFRPDRWDVLGAAVCLVGVAVIMYARRNAS